MLPQSYINSLIRVTIALLVINATIAILCTGIVAVMLFAIVKNAQWEFALIALVSLVIADCTRTLAIRQARQLRSLKTLTDH